MKKNNLLLLIWILLSFVLPKNVLPADLSNFPGGEAQFKKSKDLLVDTVKKIGSYGAAEAFDEIQQNLKKFQQINLKLKQSNNVDSVIDEVADGLKSIAQSYSKIAEMRFDVLAFFNQGEIKIGEIDGQLIKTLSELDDIIKKNQKEIEVLTSKLVNESNQTERRKMEMTIRADKNVINSTKAHILIWNKFQDALVTLKTKLNVRKENIDLLMHGLKQNARVYQAAASAVELRKTASAALKNLSALEKIDDVLGELYKTIGQKLMRL